MQTCVRHNRIQLHGFFGFDCVFVFFSVVFFGSVYGTELESRSLNSYRAEQLMADQCLNVSAKKQKVNVLLDSCTSPKDAVAAGAQASSCKNTASHCLLQAEKDF